MSKTIIAFGELLWDIFPEGEALGGAPANFAYRVNSLGHNAHIISRVGNDDHGWRAKALLKEKGLSFDHIQTDPTHPTGTVPITYTKAGHEFTILPNVAYDFIEPSNFPIADAICFGTLIQRSDRSRETLYQLLDSSDALKVLDLNLRKDCFTPQTIDSSLRRADILKLNEDEAKYVAELYRLPLEDFARAALSKWNLEVCIVTLGEKGALAASRGEVVQSSAKLTGPFIDSVGCGDAFTAMFLHSYLEGKSLDECCRQANRLGAAVAQTRGGMSPVTLT